MAGIRRQSDEGGLPDGAAGLRSGPDTERQSRGQDISRLVERHTLLERTIEGEIIPRLMLAHRGRGDSDQATAMRRRLDERTVGHFTHLVLEEDDPTCMAYLADLRSEGVSLESLFLDLISPAARRLGRMWEEDTAGFAEVTIALCRLHRLFRSLCSEFQPETDVAGDRPRMLLLPVPGEQHLLGVLMVQEFFRRAGWNADVGPHDTLPEVVRHVRDNWFTIVGLSASCEPLLDRCTLAIRAIRLASCNPGLFVMVGGAAFIGHPERVARVGADAMAQDGREAVECADRLRAAQRSLS